LIDEIQLTQEKLSDRVGKKRSTIANYMRLLKLDPIIQTGIRDGFVSMGHGRALVNIESKEDQISIYEKIVGNKLSVRDTERLVKAHHEGSKPPSSGKKTSPTPEFIKTAKDEITNHLSSKVVIQASENGKGKITIPFQSEEEFLRIKKVLLGK